MAQTRISICFTFNRKARGINTNINPLQAGRIKTKQAENGREKRMEETITLIKHRKKTTTDWPHLLAGTWTAGASVTRSHKRGHKSLLPL